MADRRELQKELNRINELYQEYDLRMRKAGASDEERQKMRDMMNAKKQEVISQMGDDLQKLNQTGKQTISGGTVSKGLSQSGIPDAPGASKFKNLLKKAAPALKAGGKALPVVGAIAAGLSSDDAAAAGMDIFIPGGLEGTGPQKGSEDYALEKGMIDESLGKSLFENQKQGLQKSYSDDTPEIQQARIAALKKLKDKEMAMFKEKTLRNRDEEILEQESSGVGSYFSPENRGSLQTAETVKQQLEQNKRDRDLTEYLGKKRTMR
jgi:hypothetical protein